MLNLLKLTNTFIMIKKRDCYSLKSYLEILSSYRVGLLAMLFCFGTQLAQASSETSLVKLEINELQSAITGTITDSSGTPLPGANVIIAGTTTGTVADFDGNYSINASSGDVLVFSYTGFNESRRTVGNQSVINVTLEEGLALDEVIVIAYGTSTKKDLTGAVGVVSAEDLNSFPVTNIDQALQGKTAGVQIVSNSGAPGSSVTVNIRGVGSFSNTTPLYVVDGYPTQDISYLNPNSISSITILKDASAGAIYGVRASNGVVIIETKKGSSGKVTFEVDTFSGVRFQPKLLNVLDASTFATFATQIGNSTDTTSDNAIPYPGWSDPGSLTNVNWQDAAFDSAFRHTANLTVRGGGDNSRFAFNAGIYDEDGVVITSKYKRYNMGLNGQFDVTDKFRVNASVNYSASQSFGQLGQGFYNIVRLAGNIPHLANVGDVNAQGGINPSALPYDNNGNYGGYPDITQQTFRGSTNILANALERDANNINNNLLANIGLELDFFDGFTAKAKIGANTSNSVNNGFNPSYYRSNANVDLNSTASFNYNQNSTNEWLAEGLLEYNKSFNKHNLNVLGGVSAQRTYFSRLNTTGSGFLNNEVRDIAQSANISVAQGYSARTTLASTFGRLNYNFDQKYYITATIRRDGVGDRFGENNLWGVFPSFAAGWNIDEENFMDDSIFDILKVRGSWGETGSFFGIDPFKFAVIYSNGSANDDAGYQFGGSDAQGLYPEALPNPDLKWETQVQTDIGLEGELFNRSLYFTVDWFKKESSDFLFNETIPVQNGFTSRAVNAGNVVNKGLEMLVGYRKTSGDFTWDISANVTTIDNEVTALTSEQDFTILSSEFVPAWNSGNFWSGLTRSIVGGEVGAFYTFRADGLFQNQAEINALNASAQAAGFDFYQDEDTSPGDRKFIDINNDGVVDSDDREVIGSPIPDFYGGLNLNFSYKGFDLGIDLYGSYGGEIMNFTRLELESLGAYGLGDGFSNVGTDYFNGRWTGEGTSNTYARAIVDDSNIQNGRASDYYMEDGSFLRLRNLRFGYSLPSDFIDKVGMTSIKIYVSGQNLHTWTKYTGYDPEIGQNSDINGVSSVQTRGIDAGSYPITKSLTLGVNLKF